MDCAKVDWQTHKRIQNDTIKIKNVILVPLKPIGDHF